MPYKDEAKSNRYRSDELEVEGAWIFIIKVRLKVLPQEFMDGSEEEMSIGGREFQRRGSWLKYKYLDGLSNERLCYSLQLEEDLVFKSENVM